jgi:DNA-binding NtrC family response regulator
MNCMELVLFAPIQFALDQTAKALRGEGLSVHTAGIGAEAQPLPARFDEAVLIFPEQGVVSSGELAVRVRETIGGNRRLILCAPPVSPSDRGLLMECGADDVIAPRSSSPLDVAERILAEMIVAGRVKPDSCGTIRGASAPLRKLYQEIALLASLNEPVLILGENGAGKELVAKELHEQSGRGGELLPVNCPAIPRELFASELFGHERGAFTGAIQSRAGKMVAAGKGTIFLDEIGDLDSESQVKLLRVLEERRVMPVGSNKWQPIHARIVLATNADLDAKVADGRFRQDLYMRLQGFTLTLPPLRERRADLPLLVRHFVEEYNREYNITLAIPAGSLDCLFRHDWPGNIRELRSAVRKSAAYADRASGLISAAMLQESVRPRELNFTKYSIPFDPAVDTWHDVVDKAQRAYFRAVLALEGGNKEAASKRVGLSRSQFYEKLKAIERPNKSRD